MENNNEDPVNARPKADTRWKPGTSDNPKGMKRGSRHKASLLAESLFDGEADRLSRRCILSALQGDVQAMKLCIERILPPVRERPCKFRLPKIESLNDASRALALLIAAVSDGELLPSEGRILGYTSSHEFRKPLKSRVSSP
jgi:hypothetical protein